MGGWAPGVRMCLQTAQGPMGLELGRPGKRTDRRADGALHEDTSDSFPPIHCSSPHGLLLTSGGRGVWQLEVGSQFLDWELNLGQGGEWAES